MTNEGNKERIEAGRSAHKLDGWEAVIGESESQTTGLPPFTSSLPGPECEDDKKRPRESEAKKEDGRKQQRGSGAK